LLRSPARFQRTAARLVDLYRRHRTQADRDPSIREAVMRAWMDAEAYNLASYHTVGRVAKGGKVGAEASTNKIFWSELDLLLHETALRILGPRAEIDSDAEAHEWLEGFLFAQAGPIYAGTNEIQRNIPSGCSACRARKGTHTWISASPTTRDRSSRRCAVPRGRGHARASAPVETATGAPTR
jgi:hypothetical protein